MQKVGALVEVTLVFSLILLLTVWISRSTIGRWEKQALHWPFAEYGVIIALPLLLLAIAQRNCAAYGLLFRNIPYHVDVAATGFVPVAAASTLCGMVDYKGRSGSLILAAAQIAALFAVGWLLQHKPPGSEDRALFITVLALACAQPIARGGAGSALLTVVFYVFFLGFGEELLFRGFIQSRLNIAFGRPFQFFGVQWGWGVIITATLFGLMHALNLGSLADGQWEPAEWWGFWTFFAGLVFGLLRERSGSIIAPAILHGVPQAIAQVGLCLYKGIKR